MASEDGTITHDRYGAPHKNTGVNLHAPDGNTELPAFDPEDTAYFDPIIERSYYSLTSVTAEIFLIHLANTGQFVVSARMANVATAHINYALKHDKYFPAHFNEAKQLWMATLEREAYRRGVVGIDTPIINNKTGQVLGHTKKYSDRLLELLLKKADPYGYGNKTQLELNVNAGVLVIPPSASQDKGDADHPQTHLPIEDDNTIETTAVPVKEDSAE